MKILGQEISVLRHQALSLIFNIRSWVFSLFPSYLFLLSTTKSVALKDSSSSSASNSATTTDKSSPSVSIANKCVRIECPGGLDQLKLTDMANDCLTVGYNVENWPAPFVTLDSSLFDEKLSPSLVVVKIEYFSVNYADVTIRWGLYESALRYVGYPIVPGFDFTGTIEWAGSESGFKRGDDVFGFTLFGAYSQRLLVPSRQVRRVPTVEKTKLKVELSVLSGFPAVAATALHAVSLAGGWPAPSTNRNKAVLVHSAAGGVGSMLLQVLKIQGFYPIVAVIGSSHKKDICLQLGADAVIDKSSVGDLWAAAKKISPTGYSAIFDANGIETIGQSFEHLSQCGRLIVYGFHSNVPKATSFLSPFEWVRMIGKMASMPKFDPMSLCLESKVGKRRGLGGKKKIREKWRDTILKRQIYFYIDFSL